MIYFKLIQLSCENVGFLVCKFTHLHDVTLLDHQIWYVLKYLGSRKTIENFELVSKIFNFIYVDVNYF